MANYFMLELDTSPPILEIAMPQYTSQDIYTDISIKSNESLMNYQDVYLIDSIGDRYDLTLNYSDKKFTGKMIFNQCSLGIANLYCRLKDEVGNLSDLYHKSINIGKSGSLKLKTKINNQGFNSVILEQKQDVIVGEFKVISNVETTKIKILTNERTVKSDII